MDFLTRRTAVDLEAGASTSRYEALAAPQGGRRRSGGLDAAPEASRRAPSEHDPNGVGNGTLAASLRSGESFASPGVLEPVAGTASQALRAGGPVAQQPPNGTPIPLLVTASSMDSNTFPVLSPAEAAAVGGHAPRIVFMGNGTDAPPPDLTGSMGIGMAGDDVVVLTPSRLRLDSRVVFTHATATWLTNAIWALLIWLKLDGPLEGVSWWVVWIPALLNHLINVPLQVVVLVRAEWMIFRQIGPPPPPSATPGLHLQYAIIRYIRLRSHYVDAANSLLESVAVGVVKVLFCQALASGQLASTSLRLMFTPLWVVWVLTTALLCFKDRSERMFGSLRDLLFAFMLFVAFKVDNQSSYSWRVVFLVPWMWFSALLLVAMMVVMLLVFAKVWARPRELLLPIGFACLLLSTVPQFLSYIALVRRLDGDSSTSVQTIMLPNMLSWLLMWCSGGLIARALAAKERVRDELLARGAVWTLHELVARRMTAERDEAQRRVDELSEDQVARMVESMMAGKTKPGRLKRVGAQLYRRIADLDPTLAAGAAAGAVDMASASRRAAHSSSLTRAAAAAAATLPGAAPARRPSSASAAAGSVTPRPALAAGLLLRGSFRLGNRVVPLDASGLPVGGTVSSSSAAAALHAELTAQGAEAAAAAAARRAQGDVEAPAAAAAHGHGQGARDEALASPAAAAGGAQPASPMRHVASSPQLEAMPWHREGGQQAQAAAELPGGVGGDPGPSGRRSGTGSRSSSARALPPIRPPPSRAASASGVPGPPASPDGGAEPRARASDSGEASRPAAAAGSFPSTAAVGSASARRRVAAGSSGSGLRAMPSLSEACEGERATPASSTLSLGAIERELTGWQPGRAGAGSGSGSGRSSSQLAGPGGSLPAAAGVGGGVDGGGGDGEEDELCVICYDAAATCVLLECGHGGFCRRCAYLLFVRPPNECPTCRAVIDQVVEVDSALPVGEVVEVK